MALAKVTFLILTLVASIVISNGYPSQHLVRHRIHVPTKIKTIYHTKIIKVPEHHHYIHEKEKPHIVKIPEHHHYFHEKENEKLVDIHSLHQDEGPHIFQHDYDNTKEYDFDNIHHNVFKKHAPPHLYKKTSKSRKN